MDRARGGLRFGDGRAGADPAAGVAARRAGARSPRRRRATATSARPARGRRTPAPRTAVNPVAGRVDGADAESLEPTRQRAADALTARDRTVTADDASVLAQTTPGLGLARAHVTPGVASAVPVRAGAGRARR